MRPRSVCSVTRSVGRARMIWMWSRMLSPHYSLQDSQIATLAAIIACKSKACPLCPCTPPARTDKAELPPVTRKSIATLTAHSKPWLATISLPCQPIRVCSGAGAWSCISVWHYIAQSKPWLAAIPLSWQPIRIWPLWLVVEVGGVTAEQTTEVTVTLFSLHVIYM